MSATHVQPSLGVELARIKSMLRVRLGRPMAEASDDSPLAAQPLERISAVFGLDAFERDVLVLCLAVELDGEIGALLVELHGLRTPTLGLALSLLPDAHWSATAPTAPLRRWRLIETGRAESVGATPIRLNETVFHALLGTRTVEPALAAATHPVSEPPLWAESHQRVAAQLAALWPEASGSRFPVAQLLCPDPGESRAIAAEAARALELDLWRLPASSIPSRPEELAELALLLDRDAILFSSALLIDADLADPDDLRRISALLDRITLPAAICSREPLTLAVPSTRFDIERPTAAEQTEALRAKLGPMLNGHATDLDAAASHFRVASRDIESAVRAVTAGDSPWTALRRQTRTAMEGLAQRIEPRATLDDLILPEASKTALREMAAHVAQRQTVFETWGFGARSALGQSVTALFAGPSGTGKTMAAEAIAHALDLDVYRIDLSAVVSKYIGETERNLRRVFDAAEGSGAVLIFDEADALFGKRSEVKDSHDRYANLEVSYLLQRMEAYRGVAILTTNLKNALDSAFMRRLRYVVNFPFPDATMREAIWRGAFPERAPRAELDFGKLAKLSVTGGHIRNIVVGAAFLAAAGKRDIDMGLLLQAARTEMAKLDRAVNDAEVAGWA